MQNEVKDDSPLRGAPATGSSEPLNSPALTVALPPAWWIENDSGLPAKFQPSKRTPTGAAWTADAVAASAAATSRVRAGLFIAGLREGAAWPANGDRRLLQAL
jgi:hypothetical protein